MSYLLDTNICIYVINSKPEHVFDHFRTKRTGDIAISTVAAAELAYGVAKSKSERNKQALELFLSPLEILPLDAILVTNNTKEFSRVPGLRIENWA